MTPAAQGDSERCLRSLGYRYNWHTESGPPCVHRASVQAAADSTASPLEHFNLTRFESILFDSLCESIRIDSFSKKSAFRFTSCSAVFLAYLLYSLSRKKYTTMHAIESYTVQNIDKNSYAMHAIKITPKLLFEYQCTSSKFIRLPNIIE